MRCPLCERAARFRPYQPRRLSTAPGEVRLPRAYHYCGRCRHSPIPHGEVPGSREAISPGLLPPAALAGMPAPFTGAARGGPRRLDGVRASAPTALRCTRGGGERLRARLEEGRAVEPARPEPNRTAPREGEHPAAYGGPGALGVPM
jgi:hypothetical protein